MKANLAIS